MRQLAIARAFANRTLLGLVCCALLLSGATIAADHGTNGGEAAAAASEVRALAVDPSTWTAQQLAAQLVLAGLQPVQLTRAQRWANRGVGGFMLFGSLPRHLRGRLAAISANGGAVAPFIASDEEGGTVQRLRAQLGPLPSAASMGATKTPAQVTGIARRYGRRMRSLGVAMDLAPVADLKIPGRFIAADGRAFARNPRRVGEYVSAWDLGMRQAGVSAVVKHWPGHGSSADTHVGSGRTPQWDLVQGRDLVPFRIALSNGARAVMVGHLTVPGLTEPGLPASMSPRAMAVLRAEAGPTVVIMTDSLSMGAVTGAMAQSVKRAALRALRAGSDIAMLNGVNPMPIVAAIAAAIENGSLPRVQVLASVNRVLALKSELGLLR